MKREELDRLRAKYLQGESTLEEERLLKENSDDAFFGSLKKPTQEMDWDFDSFMNSTAESKVTEERKVFSLPRRIIMLTSIAASLLIAFFIFRKQDSASLNNTDSQFVAHKSVDSINEVVEYEAPKEAIEKVERKASSSESKLIASVNQSLEVVKKSSKNAVSRKSESISPASEELLYVEVNGVRIYDEDEAIEITQTALNLATNNLKRGIAGVERIKHLNIEI